MKSPIIPLLAFVSLQLGGAATCIAVANRWAANDKVLVASVSEHDAVLAQARNAESRSRQLEGEGAARYTYQLFQAARSDLRNKFYKAAAEMNLTISGGNVEDKRIEATLSGTSVNALKLLSKVEQEFPELRLRSVTWAGQRDGSITINVNWDVWQIPAPGAGKANS